MEWERGGPVPTTLHWKSLNCCVGEVAQLYLTASVDKVVLQKPIPTQIPQPILCTGNQDKSTDYVGGLTFAKRRYERFL